LATKTASALSAIEFGVAARPFPLDTVLGDAHLVEGRAGNVLIAAIDGLGHGSQAAVAAGTAASILKKYASDSVVSLVKRCHRTLMMTRGAVMTLASIDVKTGNMTWVGVGNVEGLLLRADNVAIPATERAYLYGGLVGYQMPILRARKTCIQKNDLLILTTDGMGGDVTEAVQRNDPPQRIAEQILARHFKGNDDGVVLVARYLGAPHE
jgi:phosphoserine phosphatase RsbX